MPSLFYRWSERPEQFRLLLLKVVVLLVVHNDYELASAQISVYYNLEPFSCTHLNYVFIEFFERGQVTMKKGDMDWN